ncbi:MAG: allantoinase AllB [Solirubrobacterales bacterium]|nr:allantoinase AllB [Solirubrobacterales bacterium]
MEQLDMIVRGGAVVGDEGTRAVDVAIQDGVIVAVAENLDARAPQELDAAGLHVLPGAIDVHVHCNEPGRTAWEGFATATSALATGGATAFADMPLNSAPPTIDGEAFDRKLEAALASSVVDFALWGGLVPGNLDRREELAERGVIGFKAFMAPSGLDDFPAADDLTLLEGMKICARLGLPVAVHAENATITAALARRAIAAGATSAQDYLDSRPVIAELEAIKRALAFAGEAGCALHVVHVSTGRGVAVIAEGRAQGVDVTCETCPHYLLLTEDDLERLGPVAKCAPPLRRREDQQSLWTALAREQVDMVCSDHSPCSPELKDTGSFFSAWGGITGAQTTLTLLLTEGYLERNLPLSAVAYMTAQRPAQRFALSGKGRIEPGADADLALVRLGTESTLQSTDLRYRHPISAWTGRRLRARVTRTILRGETVFDGRNVVGARGRLLTPDQQLVPNPAGRP